MKLYTRVLGQGPDLVLLHGWGMNEVVWSAIVPNLAHRHRVTLVELPGHGGSDYDPAWNSLESWASACLEVMPKQADWIGWSLGGHLALRAALDAPHRVRKLLLVNSSPRFVKGPGWPHAVDEPTLRQFSVALKRNHQQTLARFLSLQVQGDEAARESLRLLRSDLIARPEPHPKALEQGLDLLLDVDLRDQLPNLRCPCLWLLGERDTLVPAGVAEDLARMSMPDSRVRILRGCAHAPFISHPVESLEALNSFIGVQND